MDGEVSRVVSGINMAEFGLDFLSFVDPNFVRDVDENMEWYINNFRESHQFTDFNEILLNVGYPSR
jgi:hypothetical protein